MRAPCCTHCHGPYRHNNAAVNLSIEPTQLSDSSYVFVIGVVHRVKSCVLACHSISHISHIRLISLAYDIFKPRQPPPVGP